MSDDVLSNKSTNSLVAVGGSVTGEIERSGRQRLARDLARGG